MSLLRTGRSALVLLSLSAAASTASCAPPRPAEATAAETDTQAVTAAPAVVRKEPADIASVRARLALHMPDAEIESVRASEIPGLYEVRRGALYGYVTADGKYLISGDLVNMETGEEITENARKDGRVAALAKLGDQYIEFDPPGGKAQNVVTVFTDVDCGYCRKLHNEIASYNALGIGIRYLFFPRSGPGSPSYGQAEAVWCSADRKNAFTRAKQGQHISAQTCKTPVQKQYELGLQFGLRGTPMMVLPNGEIVNGYVPADRLAERIVSSSLPSSAATAGSAAKSAP